jgi:endonuclease G
MPRTDELGLDMLELPDYTPQDLVIRHDGFVLSYDADARIPKWVAYELTAEETNGDAERDELIFRMDPSYNRTQAMREDYYDSGWTKGHMACAGDFKWDSDAMEETFYLTNICPQNEELNKGDWNFLERQVRRWAREYGRVWVVSGPVIGSGRYGTIGEHRVVVPDAFFKAVMVQDYGKYRSIAFIMGNDDRRYYLYDCSMSVDDLEAMTGLDFFTQLPDDVEEASESRCRPSDWGIKAR